MLITSIKLKNFRNYKNLNLNLSKGINIFYGNNAQGKTNIIESIYLCSIGRSFRTKREKEIILLGENNSKINIEFEKKDRNGNIEFEISDKKNILINGVKIKKLSELLGNINVVIFTPDDINIIKGGPSLRRRFLDIMIGQLKPIYIYNLNLYLKYLEQKNNYLKKLNLENINDEMLDIWNEKLAEYAEKVYNYRIKFINFIKEKINSIHSNITNADEKIEIEYISDFKNLDSFKKALKNSKKNDILKGYTTIGIHKDDFIIKINGKPVSIYGSQGQHRTVILSLKMCELQIVKEEIGETPILLLDDFMSELDSKRQKNLLDNIKDIQVIITCTEKFKLDNLEFKEYYVCDGNVF